MFQIKNVKKLVRIFFMLSIVSCLQANIPNDREIKGLYSGVNKHLSPIHGWLLLNNGCMRKIYDYGVKDDAVTLFVTSIFRRVNNDFRATKDYGRVATYFDTQTIGELLAAIETNPDNIKLILEKIVTSSVERFLLKKAIHKAKKFSEKIPGILKKLFDSGEEYRKNPLQIKSDNPLLNWPGKGVDGNKQENIQKWILDLSNDKKFMKGTKSFLTELLIHKGQKRKEAKKIVDGLKTKKTGKAKIEILGEKIKISDEEKKLIAYVETIKKTVEQLSSDIKLVTTFNETKEEDKLISAYINSLSTSLQTSIFDVRKNKISSFVAMLILAYQESGQLITEEKQSDWQKYPQDLPTFILLAFLMSKIKTKDQLKYYFAQFKPSILKENATENMWSESFEVGKEPQLKHFDKIDSIQDQYESLCFAVIGSSSLPKLLPHEDVVPSRIAEFKTGKGLRELKRADCVEIAVLNFIRLILALWGLIDKSKQIFDLSHLLEKIVTIYAKQNKKADINTIEKILDPIMKILDKKNIYTNNSDMHKQWGELIANLKQVKYLIKCNLQTKECDAVDFACPLILTDDNNMEHGTHNHEKLSPKDFFVYELAGYPSSYVKIINHVFGFDFKNFKEMCDAVGITYISGLTEITDDSVYNIRTQATDISREERDKLTTGHFNCLVDGHETLFSIIFSIAHSEITITPQSKKGKSWPALQQIKDNLDDYHMRNLGYGFSELFNLIPDKIFNDKKLAYSLFLLSNISEQDARYNVLAKLFEKTDLSQNKIFKNLITHLINTQKEDNCFESNIFKKVLTQWIHVNNQKLACQIASSLISQSKNDRHLLIGFLDLLLTKPKSFFANSQEEKKALENFIETYASKEINNEYNSKWVAMDYANIFEKYDETWTEEYYDKILKPFIDNIKNLKKDALFHIRINQLGIINIVRYISKKLDTNKQQEIVSLLFRENYFSTDKQYVLLLNIAIFKYDLHLLCEHASKTIFEFLEQKWTSKEKGTMDDHMKTAAKDLFIDVPELLNLIISDNCGNVDPRLKKLLKKVAPMCDIL